MEIGTLVTPLPSPPRPLALGSALGKPPAHGLHRREPEPPERGRGAGAPAPAAPARRPRTHAPSWAAGPIPTTATVVTTAPTTPTRRRAATTTSTRASWRRPARRRRARAGPSTGWQSSLPAPWTATEIACGAAKAPWLLSGGCGRAALRASRAGVA